MSTRNQASAIAHKQSFVPRNQSCSNFSGKSIHQTFYAAQLLLLVGGQIIKADIPANINEISAPWLENVLQKSAFIAGHIDSLTFEVVEGGYTGLNYRLFISTSEQKALTVFAKFPVGNSYNTKSADNKGRFLELARNEIRFYREIANQSQIPIPRCLYSASGEDNSLLILEDLGNSRLTDNRHELQENQLSQIAVSMATFHKHFWGNQRLESLDWVTTRFAAKRNYEEEIQSFQRASHLFVNQFKSHLSSDQIHVIGKIAFEYPRLKTAVASPPLTLTHGDWTSANLIWRESDNKVYVIDWAGLRKGSYLWDIIKFLDFEMDKKVLDTFLNAYAKTLNGNLTLVEFNDLYKAFFLAQAWYLCGTIEFIAGIKEEFLHDPGTQWIWEFVNNKKAFSHLYTKLSEEVQKESGGI